MIKQILAVISFILAIFLYGRKSAKDSIKHEDNEIAVKKIQKKNEIQQDVHNLPDSELNKLQRKYTKRSK